MMPSHPLYPEYQHLQDGLMVLANLPLHPWADEMPEAERRAMVAALEAGQAELLATRIPDDEGLNDTP